MLPRLRGWLVGRTYVTSHLAYLRRAASFDEWATGPSGISVALRLAYEAFPAGEHPAHEIAVLVSQPVKRLELVVTATAGAYHLQEDVVVLDAKAGTIHRRRLPTLPLLRLWFDNGIRISVETLAVDLRYAEFEDGRLHGAAAIQKIRPIYDPYLRSRWGKFDRRVWNLDLISQRQQEIARDIHDRIAGSSQDQLDRRLARFAANRLFVRAAFWLPIWLGFSSLSDDQQQPAPPPQLPKPKPGATAVPKAAPVPKPPVPQIEVIQIGEPKTAEPKAPDEPAPTSGMPRRQR